jgi:hypothetical protein
MGWGCSAALAKDRTASIFGADATAITKSRLVVTATPYVAVCQIIGASVLQPRPSSHDSNNPLDGILEIEYDGDNWMRPVADIVCEDQTMGLPVDQKR